ncbi:hypothetical protein GVN16_08330 [Emticicia sp. CRIBPO]|uniref:hypothetical protein n=1 Tax=Emticicia sp. CRIBPO TaxID=2683258 RepID=UPI001411C274|nr:hypothetical protein [Emticicia sp. CRIBPO]NBA85762.1 hypothetical protein [Emticicia sp. CRIBPO]
MKTQKTRKILYLAAFLFSGLFANAQSTVLQGLTLIQDKPTDAQYVLLHIDQKDVSAEVKKYLTEFGKVVESPKNHFKVDNPRSVGVSDHLSSIMAKVEEYKDLTKVYFIFMGNGNKPLEKAETDEYKSALFVEKFGVMAYKNLEIRLGELDIKQAEENYNDAQKNVKKIEKSLESNLKDQEKLGKKLDASPEAMTKLLSEKEEITKKMYGDNETLVDNSTEEELKKAALKKEKEIVKNQKDKEKTTSKLEKKENDFNELKNNLFEAKARLKNAEVILDNKKSNLRVLTK